MPASILIVDDEINVLSALTRCFKRAGIRTDACTSGRQAVSYLMENEYDCIISDYKMPEMDGFEFFEIAAEITSTTPRLLLSGHVDSELLETAVNNCQRGVANKRLKRLLMCVQIREFQAIFHLKQLRARSAKFRELL